MKTLKFENKPKQLVYPKKGNWYVLVDIKPEYIEETKFKNSAFVKTGKLVPTGFYTAQELLISPIKRRLNIIGLVDSAKKAIDEYSRKKILKDFVWNGYKVWLSAENQQNYASWLTAVKSSEAVLPLTAKFTINNNSVLYDFNTVNELEDFYARMVKYINDCVNENRRLKEEIENNKVLYKDSLEDIYKND